MTQYNNTDPCPKCGGTDYIYTVADGPEKPGNTHYIHLSTSSKCKKCGHATIFWNHETGFIESASDEKSS